MLSSIDITTTLLQSLEQGGASSRWFSLVQWQSFPPLLFFLLFILVCNGIYNRYFHPLRQFPGPFWGSVTDFYKIYLIATKHISTYEMELHHKYGPIVRMAPNLLVFNDSKMIPAVYNKYADKGDFYSHGVMGESAPIFQTRKQEDHAPKRKIIARSLSLRNLPAIEERIDERLDLMRTIMIEKFAISGLEFDFPEWIRMNLYDMVTQLTFSDLIGFVKHGQDVDGFIAGIYSMSWFAGLIATLPWLMNPLIHNNLTKRFFLPRSGDKSGTGQVMKYQDKMVEEHLSRPDHGPDRDILHNLLQTRTPDGSSLPIEDVKAETMIFLFTASVTLSAIVCPFINYVCSNPQVLATLSAEIDSFESKKEISSPIASYRESSRMPYLMACIEETLRLAPPTPVALTRKIGTGGTMLNGVFIPEGVEIGANPYVINRDPGLFGADAHLFRPERWLQDASCTRHMSKHIFTWGFGVRDCAGKAMARLMLQKLCLQLVRDFTFALSGSGRGRAHSTDRGLCFYRDQWVSIRMRERP